MSSAPPVAFARLLRRRGVPVAASSVIDFAAALTLLGADTTSVYWSGRTTLLSRPDDIPVYDQAFKDFWSDQSSDEVPPVKPEPLPLTLASDDPRSQAEQPPDEDDDKDEQIQELRFSRNEVLRSKDLGQCNEAERAEVLAAIARLRVGAPTRPSRRLQASRRRHGQPDLRRTLRASLRTGGEPLRRMHRKPRTQPRRLILLIDVSGSMDPYARALAHFAHAAVVARQRVEVFTIGTRLTRVTRQLRGHDPEAAVAAAADAVTDWSGGTRLGEALRLFNDRWGVAGLARGAVVVVLSDGWDRGEPHELGDEMARLARVAHRLIWVNPLKAGPGYQPLAGGMAAALPHLDQFVAGHSFSALAELADLLNEPLAKLSSR